MENFFNIPAKWNKIKNWDNFFDKKGITEYRNELKGFLTDTKYVTKDLNTFKQYLKDNNLALSGFSKVINTGKNALKSFGATLASMGVTWLASEVISIAVTMIDNYIHRVENAKKALDEFSSSVKEQEKSLSSNDQWIQQNGDRYAKLAEGVDEYGHNISLTSDEFSEYRNITKEIADMFPNMVSGYNDQNEAIIKNKGNVEALTKAYEDQKKAYYATIRGKSDETFSDFKTATEDDYKKITELRNMMKNGFLNPGNSTPAGSNAPSVWDVLGNDTVHALQKEQNQLRSEGKVGMYTDFSQLTPQLQQKIRDVFTNLNNTIDTESEKVRPILTAYLYSDTSGYDKLDDDAKNAVQSFIQNVDSTFFENFKSDIDMETWITENVINPLKDGINSKDLAVRIQTLFSLNKKDYDSYADYVKAVLDLINSLQNQTGKDGKKIYSKTQIDNLKTKFGVGDVDSEGNVSGNKLIEQTQKKYSQIKGANEYIKTLNEDELRYVNNVKGEVKTLEDLKNKVKSLNAKNQDTSDSKKKSFKSAWKDLDNVDSKSDMKNTKKDLLALAEAGKLNKKTFNKTEGAKTWLSQLGIDADKAVKEINNLVDSAKPLSTLKSGISQIQTALNEKKENGVVGADTLGSMEAEFGDLKSWKDYEETLGSTTSTVEDCRKAQNKLATDYLNTNNFLSQLVDTNGKVKQSTKEYYIEQLKEMGITNANKVVNDEIKKQKVELALANAGLSDSALKEVDSLIDEGNQLGYNEDGLKKYITQKFLANKNSLSTSESVKNLRILAKQLGITGDEMLEFIELEELTKTYDEILKSGNSDAAHGLDSLYEQIVTKQKKVKSLMKKKATIADKDKDGSGGKGGANIGNGKSSSKNKSSSTKQEIDWIERRITTLTNVISRYNAEKENLFTVKSKNKNLNKQLKETTKLINTYSGAYYKYIAKANSVKLSGSLKKLVRNGKITGSYKDLIKKYGEKTANKIQSYENYYDKAQSARQNRADAIKQRRELKIEKNQNYVDKYNADATYNELLASDTHYIAKIRNGYINKEIKATKKSYAYQIKIAKLNKDVTEQKRLQAELDQKINDFNKTKFDNVAKDYERKLKMIEYSMTAIDNEVENIEASGSTVDKSYYLDKKKLVSERAELLKKEKSDLEKYIKNITYGTDEYYEALSTIKDIDSEISKCTKSQYELNSAIKQLNIDKFEKLQKKLGRISTENDFLVGLFEHEDSVDSDTGLITDAGKGRLWAYTSDLYVSQEKTDRDKKELDRLNKLKAEGKYGVNSGEFSSLEELEERIDSVYDTWQNDISQTYEYEKKIVDEMKSYYEKQIDILQDLIDKKKEALSAEKDLYEYQKQIKEKTQNIDTIQKQMAAYSGDSSEEAKAQLQKLKVSLEESNEDLKDTIYDKYISDQETILDNLLNEYKEFVEKRLKKFDDLLQEGINNGKAGVGYLQFIAEKNGYTIENKDVIKEGDAKDNVNNAATNRENNVNNNTNNNNSSPSTIPVNSTPTRTDIGEYDNYASNKGAAPMKAYYKQEVTKWIDRHVVKSKKKKKDYSYVNRKIWDTHSHKGTSAGAGVVLSTKDLGELSRWLTGGTNNYKKGGALANELKYLGIKGFARGGIVSIKSLDKQVKANGDDGLVSVKNGEGILTPVQTEAFMKLVKNMDAIKSPKITLPDLKKMSSETNVNYGGVTFNFELENVTNAEEFIRELQTNKKLQKSIQSVSIDRLNGGGRLSVNGIK